MREETPNFIAVPFERSCHNDSGSRMMMALKMLNIIMMIMVFHLLYAAHFMVMVMVIIAFVMIAFYTESFLERVQRQDHVLDTHS
jgi:hypothetical protein